MNTSLGPLRLTFAITTLWGCTDPAFSDKPTSTASIAPVEWRHHGNTPDEQRFSNTDSMLIRRYVGDQARRIHRQ